MTPDTANKAEAESSVRYRTKYVYAGGALAVERRYAPDGTASEWYHHRDHLGSLRIVTDEAGRKAEAHDRYPYGQEMASWTATGATTRKLFTGHERDAETGLDYMLARYYASPSGAFLSVDPLDSSAKAEDPLSWNRYAYVRGNPLNRVDPTGEDDTAKQADTHGKPPETGGQLSPAEQERRAKLERLRELQRAGMPAFAECYFHYVGGSGISVRMSFDRVDTSSVTPTYFPGFKDALASAKPGSATRIDTSYRFATSSFEKLYLGHITLRMRGTLRVDKNGAWTFVGILTSYPDRYDFNASSHRGWFAELSTTVGRSGPGRPFDIAIVGSKLITGEGDAKTPTQQRQYAY